MSHIYWVARQNTLEIPKEKDEVNKREVHECDVPFVPFSFHIVVYYESIYCCFFLTIRTLQNIFFVFLFK